MLIEKNVSIIHTQLWSLGSNCVKVWARGKEKCTCKGVGSCQHNIVLPVKFTKAIFQELQLPNLNFPPKLFFTIISKTINQWQFTSNYNSLNLKSWKILYFHWGKKIVIKITHRVKMYVLLNLLTWAESVRHKFFN